MPEFKAYAVAESGDEAAPETMIETGLSLNGQEIISWNITPKSQTTGNSRFF